MRPGDNDHVCVSHAICFRCFRAGVERTRARREAWAQRSLPFEAAPVNADAARAGASSPDARAPRRTGPRVTRSKTAPRVGASDLRPPNHRATERPSNRPNDRTTERPNDRATGFRYSPHHAGTPARDLAPGSVQRRRIRVRADAARRLPRRPAELRGPDPHGSRHPVVRLLLRAARVDLVRAQHVLQALRTSGRRDGGHQRRAALRGAFLRLPAQVHVRLDVRAGHGLARICGRCRSSSSPAPPPSMASASWCCS